MHFRISRDVKDSVEYQTIGFGKHSYIAEKKYPKMKITREKIID